MIFDDEGTLIEDEPRRHQMTVEPTRLDELWEKLAHDLHAPIESSRQEISHYRAEIEKAARAAALREVGEKVEALREFETIEPRHVRARAWNRAIDRVLDILTEPAALRSQESQKPPETDQE